MQLLVREAYTLGDILKDAALNFFNPDHRLFWAYLLISFFVIGVISFSYYYGRGRKFRVNEFLRFCFPKSVYLHPSAIMDYKIYFITPLFGRLTKPIMSVYSNAGVAYGVTVALNSWLGPQEVQPNPDWLVLLALTLTLAVLTDFGRFIDHLIEHYVPLLWQIHRVHHSAEVLTPVTAFRSHPLSGMASWPIRATLIGGFQGLVLYHFLGQPPLVTILGLNIVETAFHVLGSNLRHTHVWVSFGPFWSHIFMSPAQHQIHHSADPKHHDKNFGFIFAFWDWMFGTLYIPKEKEELVFGLGEPQVHPNLKEAYIEPLRNMRGILSGGLNRTGQSDTT